MFRLKQLFNCSGSFHIKIKCFKCFECEVDKEEQEEQEKQNIKMECENSCFKFKRSKITPLEDKKYI